MKKVLFLVLIFSSIVFAKERMLINIINNVSIPNVQNSIDSANILKNDLNEKNFTNFVKSWKKVEALYFAGDLDEDYLGKLDVYIFFKKLIASVSKPKLESGKFDYLISQYFFEYLRVKFGDQIQGIFLKSVQLPTADNIILFPEVTDEGIDSSFSAGNNNIYFSWNKESRSGLSISQVKSIVITTEIEYISHPRMKESTDWI